MYKLAFGILIFAFLLYIFSPAKDESVLTVKTFPASNEAIITRDNGKAYLIKHDEGCEYLDLYEGRKIMVHSPDIFFGLYARIVIPDTDQVCRVTSCKLIDASDIKMTIALVEREEARRKKISIPFSLTLQ